MRMPVSSSARAGLLDYGQAKQLANTERLAFARLVIALSAAGDASLPGVLAALTPLQQVRCNTPPYPATLYHTHHESYKPCIIPPHT